MIKKQRGIGVEQREEGQVAGEDEGGKQIINSDIYYTFSARTSLRVSPEVVLSVIDALVSINQEFIRSVPCLKAWDRTPCLAPRPLARHFGLGNLKLESH